jgi:hypothetical protein
MYTLINNTFYLGFCLGVLDKMLIAGKIEQASLGLVSFLLVGSEICVCINCLPHCRVTKAIGGHFKSSHREYPFTQEKTK